MIARNRMVSYSENEPDYLHWQREMNMLARLVMIVFTTIIIITSAPQSVTAQDLTAANIQSTQSGLQAARADEAAAVKEISSLEEAGAPKIKEEKLWVGELDKMKPLYAAYSKAVEPHNADAAKQRAAVDRHNAGCTGKLPKPQYDRCKGEEGPLNAWRDRISQRKADLEKQRDSLNKRRDNMQERLKTIQNELAPLRARYNAAKTKFEDARKRVSKYVAWLEQARDKCKNMKDLEKLHLCNSVIWDNANPNRPPLTNPKPPFSATQQ